jgi:hypothetical protein
MNISPIKPPREIPKVYQLKKLDFWRDSIGSLWSNWSAPRDGMHERTKPSPNALMYNDAYSKIAFQPWTSLQLLSSASTLQGAG